ncbi:MAG TPA: pit accessory protein [Rhodanobacteraceae bacterium]
MFSLQTMFGKGDKFYDLLEASAEAAREGATALQKLLEHRGEAMILDSFRAARRREKQLAAQISQALVNTFVTALDREDIEAMSNALYRIPKTIEKFAERYAIMPSRLEGVDFAARAVLLMRATEVLAEMVGELRNGLRIDRMRALQDRLQAIESEADRMLLEAYRGLYTTNGDPIKVVLAKDLFELMEKAIDRCRDVGNVIYSIVLKNS